MSMVFLHQELEMMPVNHMNHMNQEEEMVFLQQEMLLFQMCHMKTVPILLLRLHLQWTLLTAGGVVARVVTGRPAEVKHIGRLQQAAAGATKTRHLSSTAGSSAISSEEGLLWNARYTSERIVGKTLAMDSISS